MAKLSITTAWNETSAFVKREGGPLFLIAFGLMTLPWIIFQVLMPQFAPTADPQQAAQAVGAGSVVMLLLIIPILVLSLWGNVTITLLALGREAVIGNAFRHAVGRLLPLLGASLLIGVGAAILSIPAVVAVTASLRSGAAMGGGAALLILVMMVIFLFLAVRLLLMTPAGSAEPIGPVAIIRRSWQLTAGHFWKLLGFLVLLVVVLMVVTIAIGAVAGILIAVTLGRPEPGSIASFLTLLVSGVAQACFGMIFATMLARIYDQLAGGSASTAQVFE